jgi:AsmA protein
MKSKPARILLIVVAVIIVIVIALPFLISGNQFRPKIQTELSKALNREVTIGSLEFSLLSGGLKAEDIAIAEDSAFGKQPFMKAKTLAIGVDLPALIFSRKVDVRSLVIKSPDVNLVRSGTRWNFSSLGQSGKKDAGQTAGEFSVGKIAIENGRISVKNTEGPPSVFEKVDFKATDLSPNKAFPFSLSAVLGTGGKLSVDGTAGPVGKADSAETPINAKFSIDSLNLANKAAAGRSAALGGILNGAGHIKSDGRLAQIELKAKADSLQLAANGAPSKTPLQLDLGAGYDLQRQIANLSRGVVKIGSATANVGGTLNNSGRSPSVDMRVVGKDMPIGELEKFLPAVGVMLPAGSSLQGGTASADLAMNGPVDRMVTTGPVSVNNTKLVGFGLESKLAVAAKLTGSNSSDTTIQTFSASVRSAPEGLRADNINLVIPALGTCTGDGTISPNNALNFKMVAKLNSGTTAGGAAGGLGGLLSQVSGGSGGGATTLPFAIQGTTANPLIVPDVAGMALGAIKAKSQPNAGTGQSDAVGGILGGIFGKKKK